MTTEYRSIEYRLHESLVQIQEMLSLLQFDQALLDTVSNCKDLIKTKQYNVAVMGEFKRGKSSLINALLGARILPADATPTTATVNRITYGTKPKTVLTFKDGGIQEIYIDELTDYVTKITPAGESRALQITEATVYFPTVICQNHIDIIDTPGLNDEERMTQITIDMIANVDAVVVPIHARAPFSETEKKFVCQLIESDGIHNIVFVVTFMDQLDEDEYVYETYMDYIKRRIQTEVFSELAKRQSADKIVRKAHLLLDNLSIHGISSTLALESFISNNRQMRKKSHFEEFSNALLHSVTANQLDNAVRKTIEIIKHVIEQFDDQNHKRLRALGAEADELETCEKAVRQHCAESRRALDAAFAYDYDKLQSITNSANKHKNYIVSEFIRSLSHVRGNTHASIASALNEAGARVSGAIHEKHDDLKKEVYSVFESSLKRLNERQKLDLDETAEYLGITQAIGLDVASKSMLSFVETVFSNVSFSWSFSPIPNVQDLTNCNVIETVIQAADLSIAGYIDELNQAVLTIRKNWFGRFSTHSDLLLCTATQVIDQRKNAHDLRDKAYQKNYQVLSDSAKAILLHCEALGDEFANRLER